MELGKKLQLKPGQSVAVLGAPTGLDLAMDSVVAAKAPAAADAVVAFVVEQAGIDAVADPVRAAAGRQALAWIAYPKGGHQLGTDLNRDRLARLMVDRGLDPVRQIAIDDTWSALRFRPAFRER